MSPFKNAQQQKKSVQSSPAHSFVSPERPSAPTIAPVSGVTMGDVQANLERTQRFGHSLDRLSLLPAQGQRTNQVVQYKRSVQNAPQASMDATAAEPVQMQDESHGDAPKQNNTGLPDRLKAGVEHLSGIAMNDVQVHYNSSRPATVQALAYTQGADIHVGPGQERHLAHEAWHVVQQKQGRVQSTMQMKGMAINDDQGLEREADAMGRTITLLTLPSSENQALQHRNGTKQIIQRAIGFEFQARNWQFYRGIDKDGNKNLHDPGRGKAVKNGTGWKLESDGGEPEFIIEHVLETEKKELGRAMKAVTEIAGQINKQKSYRIDNYFQAKPKELTIEPKVDNDNKEDKLTADPQITGGIRFERLSKFIELLSQRDSKKDIPLTESNKYLMQNKRAQNYSGDDLKLGKALENVRAYLPVLFQNSRYNDAEREKVTGVLALLVSYLIKAPGVEYLKDFPLLSKSNLAIVITNSPLSTTPNLWFQDPDRTRKNVNDALKSVILLASKRVSNEYIYPPTPQDRNPGPTIQQWLDGLFDSNAGKDLLSHIDNPRFADPSMGPYPRVDLVGLDNKEAPIIELRRINHKLPYDEWTPFAESARRWIARLNNLSITSDLDYKP